MSEKMLDRPTKVVFCDLCGQEAKSHSKCAICKRDMCMGDVKKHVAYALEIYRYVDGNRNVSAYICKECAAKKTDLTIGQLLDDMFGESSLQTIGKTGQDDSLLQLAITLGFVTAKQVTEAAIGGMKDEQSLSNLLLEKKLITEAQIATIRATQFGAEVIVLRETAISPEVIALVNPSIARKYEVVPVGKSGDKVIVAISDPSDLNAIDSLTHLLNAEIEIRVAAEDDIAEALNKYYPEKITSVMSQDHTCPTCGHMMKPEGKGYKCPNCGEFKVS